MTFRKDCHGFFIPLGMGRMMGKECRENEEKKGRPMMRTRKQMTRVLAMLLVLMMTLGLLPVGLLAVEDGSAVVADADATAIQASPDVGGDPTATEYEAVETTAAALTEAQDSDDSDIDDTDAVSTMGLLAAEAQAVAADEDATQDEVDAAAATLQAAIAGLVPAATNATNLDFSTNLVEVGTSNFQIYYDYDYWRLCDSEIWICFTPSSVPDYPFIGWTVTVDDVATTIPYNQIMDDSTGWFGDGSAVGVDDLVNYINIGGYYFLSLYTSSLDWCILFVTADNIESVKVVANFVGVGAGEINLQQSANGVIGLLGPTLTATPDIGYVFDYWEYAFVEDPQESDWSRDMSMQMRLR